MSAQGLMQEVKKHIPFRVYGKGPVIDLFRELGQFVNKKTALQVTDVMRSDESGELVCELSLEGKVKITAALTNLKLDINHPLYRKVKNYRSEVVEELSSQESGDINRPGFSIGELYKNKK